LEIIDADVSEWSKSFLGLFCQHKLLNRRLIQKPCFLTKENNVKNVMRKKNNAYNKAK
jgi:hypothetical protein